MAEIHEYVEVRDGWYYIPGSRVSLASIIYGFRRGESPETIQQSYPSATLAQVYGALAFYLNHPEESEAYLQAHKEEWAKLEKQAKPPNEAWQKRIDAYQETLRAERPENLLAKKE